MRPPRPWLILPIACICVLVSVVSASAQILTTLTAAQIDEAIALASKPKDARRFLNAYRLQVRAMGSGGPRIGVFTTPYSRVVSLALDAHEQYKPFTAADVTPAILAPEVHVHAWPMPPSYQGAGSPPFVDVRAIVLTPVKSKDRSTAVQPSRTEDSVSTYANLFGAKFEGRGISAVFPIDAFTVGRDVRVVFEDHIETVGIGRCDDCRIEIKLDKIK